MDKFKKAINDYDYLTISDMYLQGEIKKDDFTTYKLIKMVLNNGLYNTNMPNKVKNKEEHEKDFLMVKLITEKSDYNFAFSPDNQKPILYTVLKKKNKPLSVYVAKNLKDEDIEFDFPELFKESSPYLVLKSNNNFSAIEQAVLYKNTEFLNYLFLERKFLESSPYTYKSQNTIIGDNDTYFKKLHVIEIVKGMKKLAESLSAGKYAENLNSEAVKDLFLYLTNTGANLNKIKFLEKNAYMILNEPDTYEVITNSLWFDSSNKDGKKGFYKKVIEHFDPFKEIFGDKDSKSLIKAAFRTNAHSWIESFIDSVKLNKKNLMDFLENEYVPLNIDDSPMNFKEKSQGKVDEKIEKTFDILIDKGLIKPEDILKSPKIMEQISYLQGYISQLEKSIIMGGIQDVAQKSLVIKKRL